MKKKTIQEQAREQGISVETLKRHMKEQREAKANREAKSELWREVAGPGWNPRAGNRKRNKGY